MAGFQTQTVVPGLQRDSLNESIGMLQDAISNEKKNRIAAQDRSLNALGKQKELINDQIKTDILKNTSRNIVDPEIDKVYGAKLGQYTDMLYDPKTGLRRTSNDPAKQKILEDRQNRWESGEFWESDAGKNWIKNYGKKQDTAKGYSDRVYNEAISRGIDPTTAETMRKNAYDRTKSKGISDAQLKMMEMKSKANLEKTKLLSEAIEKANKNYVMQTNKTGGGGSTRSGSTKNGKGGSILDTTKLGDRDLKNNPYNGAWNGFELWDRMTKSSKEDFVNAASPLEEMGLSKNHIQNIFKMPGSVDGWGGENPQVNIQVLLANAKEYIKNNPNAASGGSGSGNGNSTTTQRTFYNKGFGNQIKNIWNDYENREAQIWNKVGQKGQNILLKDKDLREAVGLSEDDVKLLKDIDEKKNNKTPTGSTKTPLLYDKSTGIGKAMSSPKGNNELLKYATQKGEKFSSEFDNLEDKDKAKVVKILEDSNKILNSKPLQGPKRLSNDQEQQKNDISIALDRNNKNAYEDQKKAFIHPEDFKNLDEQQLRYIIDTQKEERPGGTRQSQLAERELESRKAKDYSVENENIEYDEPWWNRNYSIAGRGRNTLRDKDTKSGDFRINSNNKILQPKEITSKSEPKSILPIRNEENKILFDEQSINNREDKILEALERKYPGYSKELIKQLYRQGVLSL